MNSSASKKVAKAQKDQRQTRSTEDTTGDSAPAILPSQPKEQRTKSSAAAKMAQGSVETRMESESVEDPVLTVDPDTISRLILEAINAS